MRLRSSQALSEDSHPDALPSKNPVLSVRRVPVVCLLRCGAPSKNAVNDAFAG
jgi:hypothetical protein